MPTAAITPPQTKRTVTLKRTPKLSELSKTREGYTTSFDGTRIWYKSTGDGIPLVFCNGLGCSTFYFKHIAGEFKKRENVIMLDWRAHGKSDRPKIERNMTIDALTEDLLAVMNELNIKKAIVIGHSMGVQVLFDFYKKHPERCLGLIPVCGTYGKPMDTFYNMPLARHVFEWVYVFNHLFPKAAQKMGGMIAKNPFWFQASGFLKMLNPALVDKAVIKEYIEHFTNFDPILLAKLVRSMQDNNAESLLKHVKIPTLVIAGEQDTFTPVWIAKKTHHLIPKSELLVIKKASHVALIEQPELMNLRIEKFLKERIQPLLSQPKKAKKHS